MNDVTITSATIYRSGRSWPSTMFSTKPRTGSSAHAIRLGSFTTVGHSPVRHLGDHSSMVSAIPSRLALWVGFLRSRTRGRRSGPSTWQCDDHDASGMDHPSTPRAHLGTLPSARSLPYRQTAYSHEAHYWIRRPRASCAWRPSRSTARRVAPSTSRHSPQRRSTRSTEVLVMIALTVGTTVKGRMTISAAWSPASKRRAWSGPAICPCRRRLQRHGAAVAAERRSAISPTPAWHRQLIGLRYKMIETPMPCGVLVARPDHVEPFASAIVVSVIERLDVWTVVQRSCRVVDLVAADRLTARTAMGDVRACRPHRGLVAALRRHRRAGVCNPARSRWAVLSPVKPTAHLSACRQGEAHAIVMPNVTDRLINRFVSDYLAWWKTSGHRQTLRSHHEKLFELRPKHPPRLRPGARRFRPQGRAASVDRAKAATEVEASTTATLRNPRGGTDAERAFRRWSRDSPRRPSSKAVQRDSGIWSLSARWRWRRHLGPFFRLEL